MYGYEEDDYDEEDDDICEFCGCGPYDSPKCPACKGCGGMFNPGTEECDWCEYSEECEEALLKKIEWEKGRNMEIKKDQLTDKLAKVAEWLYTDQNYRTKDLPEELITALHEQWLMITKRDTDGYKAYMDKARQLLTALGFSETQIKALESEDCRLEVVYKEGRLPDLSIDQLIYMGATPDEIDSVVKKTLLTKGWVKKVKE